MTMDRALKLLAIAMTSLALTFTTACGSDSDAEPKENTEETGGDTTGGDTTGGDTTGGDTTGGTDNGDIGGGGTDTGATNTTCAEIYDCLVNAGQDAAAQQTCINAGSPEGQQQINALLTCFDTNCADAADQAAFQECAGANCGTEIDACFPSTGNAVCLQGCTDSCPDGLTCSPLQSPAPDGSTGVCTEGQSIPADAPACSASQPCATGFLCVTVQ